jgi:hypothetical protein
MRWSDLLPALLLAAGCDRATEPPPARDRPACTDLDYQGFGRSFLQRWCTSCHSSGLSETQRYGAPPGLDLDTLAGLLEHAEAARAATLGRTMPPGATVPQDELDAFAEWLDCGAPGTEVGIDTGSAGPADTGGPLPTTPTTVASSCPWVGDWQVGQVSCGAVDLTDTWHATYSSSDLTLRDDGAGGCEVQLVRQDDDCSERQRWVLSPVGAQWSLHFDTVEVCSPTRCTLGPQVCEEGDLDHSSVVSVVDLSEDRFVLAQITGLPICPSSASFELVR